MRMNEAELISELLVTIDLGLQDKKGILKPYYSKYEKNYPQKDKITSEYLHVLELISIIFGDAIETTKFKNKTLFYSLFCAIYDLYYGLPDQDGRRLGQIPPSKYMDARGMLHLLNSQLNTENPSEEYIEFKSAYGSQTDNIKPRKIRHATIKRLLIKLIE
jgi:hypothetical protein